MTEASVEVFWMYIQLSDHVDLGRGTLADLQSFLLLIIQLLFQLIQKSFVAKGSAFRNEMLDHIWSLESA